jgi:uncharacterized membrane protein YczE
MSVKRWIGAEGRGLRRLVQLLVGLALFGVSLSMLVAADLGLDPWDVFHQGVAATIGWSIGAVVIVTSLVVLAVWVPLRQRPGLGTVANAVMVGLVFEVTNGWFDPAGIWSRSLLLAGAIVVNAGATGLYVGAGLGPGPRDGLMTGLARRGWTIRRVRTVIEVAVLAVGWVLGGQVGVGTVVFAVTIGPLVHLSLAALTIQPSNRARQLEPA